MRYVRRPRSPNFLDKRNRLVVLTPSGDLFVHARDLSVCAKPPGGSNAAGESGKDDYDKFSLPTGSGFPEDVLEGGARGFVSDAEFDRSAPKRFSCDEMKC